GRSVRRLISRILYSRSAAPPDLKEMRELRARMEVELGRETAGLVHVKVGRGGLVDGEVITPAIPMQHAPAPPALRTPNTLAALRAIGAAGLLSRAERDGLDDHYRFLRRVSESLRLFGARPPDTLELAGLMPARLAKSLGYGSRKEMLEDYRRRAAWIRALFDRVVRE